MIVAIQKDLAGFIQTFGEFDWAANVR